MDKYFINYSANGFRGSQLEGLQAAESFGFITKGYTEQDLDSNFFDKNKKILEQKRGAGYWLWKPYIILDMLNKINDGDYLVYMDSGAKFIRNPINFLRMINHKGILCFRMVLPQGKWAKGDCFHIINQNNEDDFRYDLQIQGTYLFLRKCDYSVNFVKKWLNYCETEDLITDEPNKYKNNFPEFVDHRHDQSILSLMVYNYDIMYIPQIDQYCTEWGYGADWLHVDRHGRRY
jgi:hypothetical protein